MVRAATAGSIGSKTWGAGTGWFAAHPGVVRQAAWGAPRSAEAPEAVAPVADMPSQPPCLAQSCPGRQQAMAPQHAGAGRAADPPAARVRDGPGR